MIPKSGRMALLVATEKMSAKSWLGT